MSSFIDKIISFYQTKLFYNLQKNKDMLKTIKLSGILLCFVISFIACDDEPLSEDFELNNNSGLNGVEIDSSALMGQWNMTAHNFTVLQQGSVTFGEETIPLDQSISGSYINGDIIIVFQEDGQYTVSGMATYNLTITQEGLPDQNEEIEDNLIPDSGTWSQDNGIITLVSDAGEQTNFAVTSLTNQEMKWDTNQSLPGFDEILGPDLFDFSNFPGAEDFPDFDFNVDSSFESEMTFSKSE